MSLLLRVRVIHPLVPLPTASVSVKLLLLPYPLLSLPLSLLVCLAYQEFHHHVGVLGHPAELAAVEVRVKYHYELLAVDELEESCESGTPHPEQLHDASVVVHI